MHPVVVAFRSGALPGILDHGRTGFVVNDEHEMADAIEEAMREAARRFDLLRGREPYKYLWGATDRPTVRRELRITRLTSRRA